MSKITKASARQRGGGISLLTLGLVSGGFLIFYLGSQAFTAEDAHLLHWGLAAAGGFLGWVIGSIADRLRTSTT